MGRDRLLEMLDADSPAACKLVYEIGRTLAERMAHTNATVAEVVSRLKTPRGSDDIDVFRDQLVQDWETSRAVREAPSTCFSGRGWGRGRGSGSKL